MRVSVGRSEAAPFPVVPKFDNVDVAVLSIRPLAGQHQVLRHEQPERCIPYLCSLILQERNQDVVALEVGVAVEATAEGV